MKAPWGAGPIAAGLCLVGLVAISPALAWSREATLPLWRDGQISARSPLPSLPTLVARVRPAVVQIRGQSGSHVARAAGGQLSVGTGFIISPQGYLITNEHVVREAGTVRARLFDGREVPACVVGFDATTDIALLKALAPFPLTPMLLGDPNRVPAGDEVFVIGSPFGFDHSVSAGILSAKDRIVESNTTASQSPYGFYLQTDAAINMGNSGGPMLSRHGLVIGVASAYWGGPQPSQGIGFAIPIDVVKRLLPQLATRGHVLRSRVGVDVQSVDAALAEAFKLGTTRGALVAAVEADGPAAKAGLQPGDLVVQWDTHEVAGVEDFKVFAQLTAPDQRVAVKVLRAHRLVALVLKTAAAAANAATQHPAACSAKTPDSLPALALELATQPAKGGGFIVRNLGAGAGRDAGLLPGDIILQVKDKPLLRSADFQAALAPSDQAQPLLVRREQASFWLALPPHRSGR